MTATAGIRADGGSVGAVPMSGERESFASLFALLEVIDLPSWMADAACKEHPEVNFFPTKGQSAAPAKAICRRCLVREECAEWAAANDVVDGVWGGASAPELRRMIRSRRASGELPQQRFTGQRSRWLG